MKKGGKPVVENHFIYRTIVGEDDQSQLMRLLVTLTDRDDDEIDKLYYDTGGEVPMFRCYVKVQHRRDSFQDWRDVQSWSGSFWQQSGCLPNPVPLTVRLLFGLDDFIKDRFRARSQRTGKCKW